jgi:hypothetical protein
MKWNILPKERVYQTGVAFKDRAVGIQKAELSKKKKKKS